MILIKLWNQGHCSNLKLAISFSEFKNKPWHEIKSGTKTQISFMETIFKSEHFLTSIQNGS